jgi:hypothetical protein
MPVAEREPICGFCWAKAGTREPLEFHIRGMHWRCPVCETVFYNPRDEEEMAAGGSRLEPDSDPHRHELTIRSTLRLKGTGNNGTGRARKDPKLTAPERLSYLRE